MVVKIEVDLLVQNATVVTAAHVHPAQDIAVKDGKILLLGQNLASILAATKVIDAQGAFVTPGGVDSHVHLDQDSSIEVASTGDNFESGTRSAIAGGTTTVICFAMQTRADTSLVPVVADYHRKSTGQAYCDYGFHIILTNPTPAIMTGELPGMMADGISSVKLYMTYDPLKLGDKEMLDVMMATRALGMTTMVHAENADMISWIGERLMEKNLNSPFYHSISRPQIAEDEATYRAIAMSELVDTPILLVHMSSPTAVSHVRQAQTRLLPIHAETCPHYLFLTSAALRAPHPVSDPFEGAKHICSPPLRASRADLDGMWQGLSNGSVTTFSSDHATSQYDHPCGKKRGLADPADPTSAPDYRKVPNGLPGVETRLPTLWEGGVLTGRLTPQKFVELTSSNPAKLYGLGNTKGAIAPGYDADLVIWYPTAEQVAAGDGSAAPMAPFALTNSHLHHAIDYTPFEGMRFNNWPRYTILRGNVIWDRDGGGIVGSKGEGKFLRRGKSTLSKPRGVAAEWEKPENLVA
ncbi:dihydropyrimidinase [Phyllosticta capitalensis]|uniref:dihydropyrimidinase n=1 Tax=Phyllosticta capitalensis TaxID=121624 RepID=A0ABR1YRI5_9PEZI